MLLSDTVRRRCATLARNDQSTRSHSPVSEHALLNRESDAIKRSFRGRSARLFTRPNDGRSANSSMHNAQLRRASHVARLMGSALEIARRRPKQALETDDEQPGFGRSAR